MEPFRAFERLRDVAANERMSTECRLKLHRRLEYLREQALCDRDRRTSSVILRATWRDVVQTAKTANLTDRLARESAWKVAAAFCEVICKETPTTPKTSSTTSSATSLATKSNWVGEDEFFRALLQAVKSLEAIEPTERWILYLSLKVFLSELALPKPKREQRQLLPLWKFVLPLMKKHRLLQKHPPDEVLKSKLGFFLKGNFGPADADPSGMRKGRKFPDHDYSGKQGIDTRNLPTGEELKAATSRRQ